MTELLALYAVVEAPPERVAEVVLELAGVEGEGDTFEVVKGGSRMTVTVDRGRREVAMQGEWWYRGVTSVEPDPLGSRVIHRIFNVAEGNGWAVRFVARGPLNAAPRSFAETVRRIGEQLGVPARVVDD